MKKFARFGIGLFVAVFINLSGLLLLTWLAHPESAEDSEPELELIEAPKVISDPVPLPLLDPRARAPRALSEPKDTPKPAPSAIERPSPLQPNALAAPQSHSPFRIQSSDLPEPGFDALAASLGAGSSGPGGDVSGLFEGVGSGDTTDEEVMDAESVEEPPVPKRRVSPQYPRRAEMDRLTGYVVLRALVERDGRISRTEIVTADPPGVFDYAARQAFEQWVFQPGRHRGQPVRTWVRKRLNFRLR